MYFILNRIFIICLMTLLSCTLHAKNSDVAELIKTYNQWCDAIGTAHGNAHIVVQYYAPHAILLPTLSDQILFNDKNGLNNYFSNLTSYPHIHCKTKKWFYTFPSGL